MPDDQKLAVRNWFKPMFDHKSDSQPVHVHLHPLPQDFEPEGVMNGIRSSVNVTPLGMIEASVFADLNGTNTGWGVSFPYGKKDNAYYITGYTAEKLYEPKTKEKYLLLYVQGVYSDDSPVFTGSYTYVQNGKTITKSFRGMGSAQKLFFGDSIQSCSVQKTSDNKSPISLVLYENNTKIFESQPIATKDPIVYQRPGDLTLASQPVSPPAVSITPALLAEPPKLRFLAWQDEWNHDEQFYRAFYPDGTTVTNAWEVRLMHLADPPGFAMGKFAKDYGYPRFLHIWFAHPLIDPNSFNAVTLLDSTGQPIVLGGGGSFGTTEHPPDTDNGNLGWLIVTLSPGPATNIPLSATVRLRYNLGPWENQRKVPNDFNTSVALEDGGQLTGIGQNSDGNAFVAIAMVSEKALSRQFGVVAVTKDGRELESLGRSTAGSSDATGVQSERFVFSVPLAGVAHFRIGSRPIRSIDFQIWLPSNRSVDFQNLHLLPEH
jgi:hypothetical protein